MAALSMKTGAAQTTTDGWGQSPPPAKRVRVKLTTVQDVEKELAKLYRLARAKQIDVSEASKLANILVMVARLMETANLEARLEALEVGQS